MTNKNILLLAHDGEDFYKARMPLARFLKRKGYNVHVMLPMDNYTDLIIQEDIYVQHSSLQRDNTQPLDLLKTVFEVRRYSKLNDIDLIHSFKFVPNLINSFAHILTRKKVILHIAGLGIAFANNDFKYKILKSLSQILFLFQFLRANLVIIQNPDDFNDFLFKEHFRNKIKVVKGSGVDISKFSPVFFKNDEQVDGKKIVFLCTTRLIWEKGIREMIEAFESLPGDLQKKVNLNIIGEPDNKNPRSVSLEYISKYEKSDLIHFWGRQNNVHEHLQTADVFILPSYYREGIPRSILEALASGLPVITTNVPGCNLTVISGRNGILIEPRSVQAIEAAVEKIISERTQWKQMGQKSRQLAINEFSEDKIFSEIVKLYNI